jgi:hypothetical protein
MVGGSTQMAGRLELADFAQEFELEKKDPVTDLELASHWVERSVNNCMPL